MTIDNNSAGKTRALTFADINKITQGIYETEGAQAADSSDLDDLELVLGDLEVGSGESDALVIEHLHELDDHAEDKAEAKRHALAEEMLAAFTVAAANREAAAKAKAREAQEPTPPLNEETCGLTLAEAPTDIASSDFENLELVPGDLEVGAGETDAEVIESLDADLQRTIARKTKTHDTPGGEVIETPSGEVMERSIENALAKPAKAEASEAKGSIAASDLDDLDLALGDLEVGSGENREVIGHLGELDASAEDAVKGAIAVADATARTVAMQEYKARQPKRGAPRPAACKEFSVDPTNPLAVDKVRIAYKLKGVGKTLADLEKYHPGFWALPLETDGRDEDGLSFPSRKLVLSRFLWNGETETERQKKREAKIAAKGWPANYHDLPPHQQRTIRNRLLKRKSRERAKALGAPLA